MSGSSACHNINEELFNEHAIIAGSQAFERGEREIDRMKRIKQFFLSFVVTMGLIATTFTCVNAVSYSGSQSAAVSTSVVSAKVTSVATYSTTANTRWTTSLSSSSWSNNVMSVIIGHSNTILVS